jgi:NADH:ubiquinone oxidoreductase subunit 6 (subunit J)
MQPILFWIIGAFSLVASLLAVGHPRPLRSTQGLLALLLTNVLILFMLSATLLAIELVVVTLGAAAVLWFVLMRPRKMKLGIPGRLRLNITKFIGFFVAVWVCTLLWLAISDAPARDRSCIPTEPEGVMSGWLAAITAVMLLAISAVTAISVVVDRRRQDKEGSQQ